MHDWLDRTGLDQNQKYAFKVRAKNARGLPAGRSGIRCCLQGCCRGRLSFAKSFVAYWWCPCFCAGWGKYSEVALISTCKQEQPSTENPPDTPLEMPETKPKGGLWQKLKQLPALRHAVAEGYEQLVRGIIRPPRTRYHISDLGAATFRVGKGVFQRTDFHITSTRGLVFCHRVWDCCTCTWTYTWIYT